MPKMRFVFLSCEPFTFRKGRFCSDMDSGVFKICKPWREFSSKIFGKSSWQPRRRVASSDFCDLFSIIIVGIAEI